MNRSYKNYLKLPKKKWFDPYGDDHEEARANFPPNIVQDDWNYLVNLWSDKDWKDMCEKNKISCSHNLIIHITGSKSFQQRKEEEKEKTGEELGRVQLFEVTHVKANGQAINEHTQEALMAFKNFTTQVVEGSLQMTEDEMFMEVFGPEHHGRVRGYGDGVTPTELWDSSSSSIRDLQRQLKEFEEKHKENDADLQRQLKESEEKRKESDAHLKILEAQVNRVESLLAVVMKKLSPPELAQSKSST
uniref:Uncharacterized protein n=1 Tax=Fagus sylvatica TaxID=28930 RepID=A0A2N9G784_FAGSY